MKRPRNASAPDLPLPGRRTATGGFRRGSLLVGVVLGAGITTCLQTVLWSLRPGTGGGVNDHAYHSPFLRDVLEDSKQHRPLRPVRSARSSAMDLLRRHRGAGAPLPPPTSYEGAAPALEVGVSPVIQDLRDGRAAADAVDQDAPDVDDDLIEKLRAAPDRPVHVVVAPGGRGGTAGGTGGRTLADQLKLHQERLRLMRRRQEELQQLQQRQLQPPPSRVFTFAAPPDRAVGAAPAPLPGVAAVDRGLRNRAPPLYNARQKRELRPPVNATVVEWSFRPLGALPANEDPFGVSQLCDPVTRQFRTPNATAATTTTERRKVCIQGQLPPFTHPKPRFLPDTDDEATFLLQPENRVALREDWIDWSFQTCVAFPAAEAPRDIYMMVDVGGMRSFQHFHDNGLGLIYQARQAFDLLRNGSACGAALAEHLDHKPPALRIIQEEWDLLGFPPARPLRTQPGPGSIYGEITFYPQDFDQVRVHPVHVAHLRRNMPPQTRIDPNKIVYLSRQGSARSRQLVNETVFVAELRQRIPNLVRFHPLHDGFRTIQSVVDRIGDACLVLGLHGGQLYNQFYTGPRTSILELMPIKGDGYFHGQDDPEQRPALAHRAIWHNANLLGQPYWRVHVAVPNSNLFAIDAATLDKIAQVATAAGCSLS